MTFAFVSITHSITSFPAAFLTAIEILSLCTSKPIYLVPVIKGCSFLEGLRQAPKPYSKGAPFLYCVGYRISDFYSPARDPKFPGSVLMGHQTTKGYWEEERKPFFSYPAVRMASLPEL